MISPASFQARPILSATMTLSCQLGHLESGRCSGLTAPAASGSLSNGLILLKSGMFFLEYKPHDVTLPLKALQCPLRSKRPSLMSSRWHTGPTYGLPPCPHLSGFDSFFGRTPLKGAPFLRPPGCVRGDWGKASLLVLASAAHPGGRRKSDQLWHIFLSLSTSNHSVPTHLPKENGSYHPEDTGTRSPQQLYSG